MRDFSRDYHAHPGRGWMKTRTPSLVSFVLGLSVLGLGVAACGPDEAAKRAAQAERVAAEAAARQAAMVQQAAEQERRKALVEAVATATKIAADPKRCTDEVLKARDALGRVKDTDPEFSDVRQTLGSLQPCLDAVIRKWAKVAAVEEKKQNGTAESGTSGANLSSDRMASAQRAMALAKQSCNISEDGDMLVVEMRSYVEDPNQLLSFARAIADSDAVLKGRSRSIFFYDPSGRKIAKADTTSGVRLEN